MGLIAEVLQFFRGEDGDAQIAEAKGDLGGEDIITAVNYQATGFDGNPLPGDYMLVVPGPEEGTFLVAGYLDPLNAGTAREGDVRLYVRDGDGAVQGELHLTNDGEAPDWQAEAGALIARADRTDDELAKLESAFNGHLHEIEVCTGGTSAAAPALTGGPTATLTQEDREYERGPTGADKGWVT